MQTYSQDVLNASHTMLAYPAFLAGYRTVNEAMNDHLFSDYISAFIDQDVFAPVDIDLDDYKSKLLSHFANPDVSDPLARLCFDGASKLPAFVLPTLREQLAKNGDVHRLAFLIAAYGHYLTVNKDDKRVAYEVDEPHLRPEDWSKINSHDVISFLSISPFAAARLHTYSHFVAMYKSYRTQIAQLGILFLIKQMAYHRLAMRTAVQAS
ncbi:hypothetical protein [Spirosoma sp. KNUC1025]|uniref:mannitol dehydrogenase family protein n=1 Tax=Spirosoma sp. KNUC1025 TaxID=2894082 RepID=UPI0038634142|nr:hypothetical protein LN737_25720 [Spirosoma sp. KNUC1025]